MKLNIFQNKNNIFFLLFSCRVWYNHALLMVSEKTDKEDFQQGVDHRRAVSFLCPVFLQDFLE